MISYMQALLQRISSEPKPKKLGVATSDYFGANEKEYTTSSRIAAVRHRGQPNNYSSIREQFGGSIGSNQLYSSQASLSGRNSNRG